MSAIVLLRELNIILQAFFISILLFRQGLGLQEAELLAGDDDDSLTLEVTLDSSSLKRLSGLPRKSRTSGGCKLPC